VDDQSRVEGRHRRLPPFAVGLYLITSICGILDAACFLGLGHAFAEVMTGNLILLAFAIGFGASTSIAALLVALGTFFVGALFGGRMLTLPPRLADRRIGFAVEWVALIGAVIVTVTAHPHTTGTSRLAVLGILAFGMGIQNAMIRRWGIPDLATNVMTLTMVGLLAESSLVGGDNHHAARRASSVGLFATSAVLGAFLTRFGVLWPLLLATVIFTVALPVLLRPGPPKSDPSPAHGA
jgi:uncharacterized membrane protein YoaK (UPF0700 family)